MKNKNGKDNKQRKSKSFTRMVLSIIIGVITFGALITAESWILSDMETNEAVVCKKTIEKNTKITSDNKDEYFEVVNLNANYITKNNYKTLDDIPEGIVSEDMVELEPLLTKDIIKNEDVLSYIKPNEKVVSMSIKANAVSDVVGGTIRKGDLINISIVDTQLKSSDLIYEDVFVEQVFDSSGAEIDRESEVSSIMVVLTVSEEMEQTLLTRMLDGDIKISKTK